MAGVWACAEAVVETLSCKDDCDWLFPYALGMRRWTLLMTVIKKGVSPTLRVEAIWTALSFNEWSFIMDYALFIYKTSPEELNPQLKKAILTSMTQLMMTLQQPSSPGATTFGLHLSSPATAKRGQGQTENQGECQYVESDGKESDQVKMEKESEEEELKEEKTEVKRGEEEEEQKEWTTEDGTTALQLASGLNLWKVCKVLLLCGCNLHPHPTPSQPDDVILVALRQDEYDVIHLLLDRGVLPKVKDKAVRELLLTCDLDLSVDSGLSLLDKLLELGPESVNTGDIQNESVNAGDSSKYQMPSSSRVTNVSTSSDTTELFDAKSSSVTKCSNIGDSNVKDSTKAGESISDTQSATMGTLSFVGHSLNSMESSDLVEFGKDKISTNTKDLINLTESLTNTSSSSFLESAIDAHSSQFKQPKEVHIPNKTQKIAAFKTLKDQVCQVLSESKASRFQPHVSDALKSGQVHLPAFLVEGTNNGEARHLYIKKKRGSSSVSDSEHMVGASCVHKLEPGPRVPLRVDRERVESPVFRMACLSGFEAKVHPLSS